MVGCDWLLEMTRCSSSESGPSCEDGPAGSHQGDGRDGGGGGVYNKFLFFLFANVYFLK